MPEFDDNFAAGVFALSHSSELFSNKSLPQEEHRKFGKSNAETLSGPVIHD
jgi:hypothetical protein